MADAANSIRLFQTWLRNGWHGIEDNGQTAWVWSEESAEIEIPPQAVYMDFQFHSTHFDWKGKPQRLKVFVDSRLSAIHRVGRGRHGIQVPCRGGRRIIFHCDWVRPADEVDSTDQRKLGICLTRMIPVTPDTAIEDYFDQSLAYLDHDPELKKAFLRIHIEKRKEGEFLLEKIRGLKGKAPLRVLDCGIGSGGVAVAFARGGMRPVGLDISPWCLGNARANAFLSGTSLELVRGDAENLCLADETFDVVLALDIMEHVPHPDRLLGEIGRVLKKDGIFIFRTGFALSPRNIRRDPHHHLAFAVLLPRSLRRRYVVDFKKKADEIDDFIWFKTFGSLCRFAARCGFETEPLEPERPFEALKKGRGFLFLVFRAAAALLPEKVFTNCHATWTDAYCLARKRDATASSARPPGTRPGTVRPPEPALKEKP